MPFVEDPNQKGNLIIEFDIEYPNFLHPGKYYLLKTYLVFFFKTIKLRRKFFEYLIF
jgi:hypothetical protein